MRSHKRTWQILLAVLLSSLACCSCTGWGGKRLLNWLSFELVWKTVADKYFDPTFGGIDWRESRARYRQQVMIASSADYYRLLNEMLWELNVSHLAVVPGDYWAVAEPTAVAEGSTGIDVRLFDGEAVVTSVEAGSPAYRAGLRPGFVILSIDGSTIAQIAEEAELGMEPPYNERHRIEAITSDILGHIFGPSDTEVTLVYSDAQDTRHEARVERRQRQGATATMPGFPANYFEFESERLEDGIGYIRFNWFHAALARELAGTLTSMRNAPGLIIDLRGNPGGMRDAAIAGAELLVSGRMTCTTLRGRGGERDIVLDPAYNGYDGPVVVLIDAMSKSSSEFFAACTQAIGRATIMGARSPGSVGPAETMLLPNGATFIYPSVQESTLDGTILEGHGVIPDIEVELDRVLLSEGIDSQLEAAVHHIQEQIW